MSSFAIIPQLWRLAAIMSGVTLFLVAAAGCGIFSPAELQANMEITNVRTAFKVYLVDYAQYPEKSSDLVPDYLKEPPRADYSFDPMTGRVTRVSRGKNNPWPDTIVFDISDQIWVTGNNDATAPGTQDRE
ncbi:MAG: hypothetical protein HY670_07030 [Chloroflexi bacterium]|nr:hypothetical protein [Chloroflexota bacterium]